MKLPKVNVPGVGQVSNLGALGGLFLGITLLLALVPWSQKAATAVNARVQQALPSGATGAGVDRPGFRVAS